MPLKKTPSALYMQMHQLANEKERLQQELHMLADRQLQIQHRLEVIEQDLAQMDSQITDLNNPFRSDTSPIDQVAPPPPLQIDRGQFKTMIIDY
jgi:predicted  nucleic acid-binding Zn-ribbon protein